MAIEFNCPNCSAIIRVPDNAAGGKGRCPRCNTRIKVPKASTPRAPKKEDDLGLDLFAAPDGDGDEVAAVAANGGPQVDEAPDAEPQSLEDMFAPKSRGLGELPVEAPRQKLRPGSIASSLKKKKSGGGGGLMIAVVCGLILCGVAGWYYWQTQHSDQLAGELTAETAAVLELKPIELNAGTFKRTPDEMKTYIEELQKSPVRLPSVLMQVQISSGKKGVAISVNAGAQTHFYRVDVKSDPALMKFRSARGLELEELRLADVERYGMEFLRDYQRVLDKEAGNTVLNDYRNTFAIPALVRGIGHNVVAVRGQQVYRCVYEDNDGALYFLLPPNVQEFEITGSKNKSGKSLFPGKYKVFVSGEIQSSGKSDKKSQKPTEAEAPGMSEDKNEDKKEMKDMKEMKGDPSDGEMMMDEKPKKKNPPK